MGGGTIGEHMVTTVAGHPFAGVELFVGVVNFPARGFEVWKMGWR